MVALTFWLVFGGNGQGLPAWSNSLGGGTLGVAGGAAGGVAGVTGGGVGETGGGVGLAGGVGVAGPGGVGIGTGTGAGSGLVGGGGFGVTGSGCGLSGDVGLSGFITIGGRDGSLPIPGAGPPIGGPPFDGTVTSGLHPQIDRLHATQTNSRLVNGRMKQFRQDSICHSPEKRWPHPKISGAKTRAAG